ncbi:unnamed protein product [Merluccius merluccius]
MRGVRGRRRVCEVDQQNSATLESAERHVKRDQERDVMTSPDRRHADTRAGSERLESGEFSATRRTLPAGGSRKPEPNGQR